MKKPIWHVTVDDGEYAHTFVLHARKVERVEGDQFDKGFGLKADGVLIDFSYGHQIDDLKFIGRMGIK